LSLAPRPRGPGSWKRPTGIAFIPAIRSPTGDEQSFLGDLSVVFAPRVAIERAFGPVRILLNAGFRFRQPAGFLNIVVNNELTGGGAVVWALPSGGIFLKPELMFETTFSTPLATPFVANIGGTSAYAPTPWEMLVGAPVRLSH